MLNVMLVGVGGWGSNHARVLGTLKGDVVNSLVLVDLNVERIKRFAKIYGAKYYTNIDDALRKEELDAAIIATPTNLHFEHAKKSLENGLHVLVEKPLTDTLENAIKLYDEAKSSGRLVSVGFIMRYHPLVEYLKGNARRKLGKILAINSKRTSWWPNRPWDAGVVKDLAIHDIDLARYLFDRDAKVVYGKVGSLRHSYYEDYALFIIDYGEFSGIFESNWITPYKIRYFSVTGDRAVVNIDFVNEELMILEKDQAIKPLVRGEEPLVLEDRDFLMSIVEKRKPKVTIEDGIKALATCEAILKSATLGKPVEVEYPLA